MLDARTAQTGNPLAARRAQILKAIENRTYEYTQLPELVTELSEIEASLKKEPDLFSREELDQMTACLTVKGTLAEDIQTRKPAGPFQSDNIGAFMLDALAAMKGEG